MNINVSKRVRWEISHPQWLKSVYPKCAFWHTLDIRWKGKISLGGWFFAEIVYICNPKGACGEIGRRARLRIWCRETCRFESYQAHPELLTVPPQLGVFVFCNHPKSTVLFKFFALPYFAGKKAMFNLNENNRIVMSQHPSDMRIGVNGMCGQVRKVGLDPSNGDVYIFVGRSRQLMKILHWERGGYVMYYKRLEQGRFHPRIFLREGIGFRTMRWDELVLLMEGISPKVARRKRFPNPNGKLELSRKK